MLNRNSAIKGNLREKISKECLGITDKVMEDGSGFLILCDCEGSVGVDASIIKDGVWSGLLHNRTSDGMMQYAGRPI